MKYVVWQSASGQFYCNDVTALGTAGAQWWYPARLLGLTPVDYVDIIIREFKPTHFSFVDGKTFLYSWDKEADAKRFVKWLNSKCN